MAEEKSLLQRFSEGFVRFWTFPERKQREMRNNFLESVSKSPQTNEYVEYAKVCARFPNPYDFFLLGFQPENEKDKALFEYMKGQMKEGNVSLDSHSSTLAQIGNFKVINALWWDPEINKDAGIRKLIVENPACSDDIRRVALHDSDWEVRKAAVLRPETTKEELISQAEMESNPMVMNALKERLGDDFTIRANPAVPHKFIPPENKNILDNTRKPSLDSIVSTAALKGATMQQPKAPNPNSHSKSSVEIGH